MALHNYPANVRAIVTFSDFVRDWYTCYMSEQLIISAVTATYIQYKWSYRQKKVSYTELYKANTEKRRKTSPVYYEKMADR